MDICPFDCITLQDDPRTPDLHFRIAVVDPKSCVSCRLCEIVCDKDAIFVPNPVTNLSAMLPQQVKTDPATRHQATPAGLRHAGVASATQAGAMAG